MINKIAEIIQDISGNYYGKERINLLNKKILLFERKFNVKIESVIDDKKLLSLFIDSVLVNETSFFRHLQQLKDFLMIIKYWKKNHNLRLLSAGCSTGKEVYTLGMMMLKENFSNPLVEGMDLSNVALSVARNGIYSLDRLSQIPRTYRNFIEVKENYIAIKPDLKKFTGFYRGNLLDSLIFPEAYYDVVFCRNVFIYFSEDTIKHVLYNFKKTLKIGGILVVSPVEKIPLEDISFFKPFKVNKNIFYRRVG